MKCSLETNVVSATLTNVSLESDLAETVCETEEDRKTELCVLVLSAAPPLQTIRRDPIIKLNYCLESESSV